MFIFFVVNRPIVSDAASGGDDTAGGRTTNTNCDGQQASGVIGQRDWNSGLMAFCDDIPSCT